MNPKKALITVVLACFFAISYTPNTAAQDQVEIPSWEVGWETNMDGVYELSLSGQEDIKDTIEFFVTNERMVDLNLEITIEWDESDNIPIELEYDESISIAASENQTFSIEISDLSGYSFERSPTKPMTLLLSAQEVALEQPVSTQEIEAELSVPSVFDLQIDSQSKNEILYAGSSVEYIIKVINNIRVNTNIDKFTVVIDHKINSSLSERYLNVLKKIKNINLVVSPSCITMPSQLTATMAFKLGIKNISKEMY